jgi:hypothetical protein
MTTKSYLQLGLVALLLLLTTGERAPLAGVEGHLGHAYLFDDGGRFVRRIDGVPGEDCIMICRAGVQEPLVARFADPVHDPGVLGPSSRLRFVGPDTVRESLEKTGVLDPARHGGIKALRYLAKGSSYGGVLDFSRNGKHDIRDELFYVTQSDSGELLVHNRYNYGNYLWGASARELGVPLCLVIIGTHLQNFFGSQTSRWHLDSPDDVRSIRAGFYWNGSIR